MADCWSNFTSEREEQMQNCCFSSKTEVFLMKVCYKVSLCENHQRHSCIRHSLVYVTVQK